MEMYETWANEKGDDVRGALAKQNWVWMWLSG